LGGQGLRLSEVFGFSQTGATEWVLPVEADEDAYLYSVAFAFASSRVAVATDDGRIAVYGSLNFH
jgi:hypothetical protein